MACGLHVKSIMMRSVRFLPLLISALLVSFFLFEGSARAQAWSTPEVVDSAGDVGGNPSIAVDADGKVHISYFRDSFRAQIKYATNAGGAPGAWATENLRASSVFGSRSSIAVSRNESKENYLPNLLYPARFSSRGYPYSSAIGVSPPG